MFIALIFIVSTIARFMTTETEVLIAPFSAPSRTIARSGNFLYAVPSYFLLRQDGYNILPPKIIKFSDEMSTIMIEMSNQFVCSKPKMKEVQTCLNTNEAKFSLKQHSDRTYSFINICNKRCMTLGTYEFFGNRYNIIFDICDDSRSDQKWNFKTVTSKGNENISFIAGKDLF